ncbi:hypothetical protein KAW18_15305 [candidate division WOR-3 bacterium]|nr:hypothetical protein [candidate division WOR-3 bacterium]
MKKGNILVALFIFFAVSVANASSVGFLLIDPSPSSAALASGGIDNIHSNPACMYLMQKRAISFSHIEWFTDVRIEHVEGVYQTEKFGIGAGITYLHMADIQGYDISGNPTSTFSVYDMVGLLSLSYYLGNVSIGLSGKLVQERLADVTANSGAADIGVVMKDMLPGLSCGLSVLNLGTGITYKEEKEDFPLAVKLLMHYTIPVYAYDIYMNMVKELDGNIIGGIGGEAHYFEILTIRLGYSVSNEEVTQKGLSAGIGIRFAERYSFDYASIPFSEFSVLHYAGLSIGF